MLGSELGETYCSSPGLTAEAQGQADGPLSDQAGPGDSTAPPSPAAASRLLCGAGARQATL